MGKILAVHVLVDDSYELVRRPTSGKQVKATYRLSLSSLSGCCGSTQRSCGCGIVDAGVKKLHAQHRRARIAGRNAAIWFTPWLLQHVMSLGTASQETSAKFYALHKRLLSDMEVKKKAQNITNFVTQK